MRGEDSYDIESWEPRTLMDRFSLRLYGFLAEAVRGATLVLALTFVFIELGLVATTLEKRPILGLLSFVSIVPALLLALYIWRVDPTEREPIPTLVATFLLGVVFAAFAAVINTFGMGVLNDVGIETLAIVPFFFLVVGPVEETVKWLAVRFHAYRTPHFQTAVDGAVYGAMAGLGFATIENLTYVVGTVGTNGGTAVTVSGVAVTRAIVGPNHVLWAAISGYYLGLAKIVSSNRGPIIVKGIAIPAFLHGFYNSTAGFVTNLLSSIFGGDALAWLLVYVLVFSGLVASYLFRKIRRAREYYEDQMRLGWL
ncbi:PrsW family glutamic-type intramembrane protease [Haladaptatus sp. AB643]|uniref:PrsW family intramembrane metalloprotease n=1 Tax=Haladaptatus sp. AB643 TaxID=2934174 RepID=UPI00209C3CB7|nr:PrsW family glutamic-type intramembrane protease [Haladaptatus sp. AB643]MCO8243998.1 PrsW family glutamic-type intramembrane protease [Haladaptatus sp. AB643]